MNRTKYVTYSEAFKRQVVHQIESGKFRNSWHATRSLGIAGKATVGRWLKRYGTGTSIPKRIKIMSLEEIDETKELRKRVRDLEKALADTHMRSLLNESYLEIACERMDTDPELFKKKHATKLSGPPRKKGSK